VGIWVALEKHPNIVRCFYLDTVDNLLFMFLEWVAETQGRGTSLRDWLGRGPLTPHQALDFAIDICHGLIHAGRKQPGLVHRDLKPENVLIAQGPLAKITDFGLATIAQEAELVMPDMASSACQHLTAFGGTPPYMAPEQWRGEPLDVRTDIYGIGCLLYEMLTRRMPYGLATLEELRRRHLEHPIPALPEDGPLFDSLNAVLSRCLAKEKEKRYLGVEALLEDLSTIYQRQYGLPPKVVAESGEFTAQDFTNRGITYGALGRYEEELADYTRAITLDPNDAMAFTNRGITYRALGRYEEALANHTRAIALDPNDAVAFTNRGATYHAMDRHEEALADFNHAIEIDPNQANAYVGMGVSFFELGELKKALLFFEGAAQLGQPLGAKYAEEVRQMLKG
jgi:serine/threonine protein kinase